MLPTFLILSPEPALILSRLALMFAYSPCFFICTPWVTQIDKGGSITIIDKDGLPVCTLKGRHPEMMALTASVICDHLNKV